MNTDLTFTTVKFPRGIRFVLVNDSVPRDEHCARCGSVIETRYVHDLQTLLFYCDTQCFPGRTHQAALVAQNPERKVS